MGHPRLANPDDGLQRAIAQTANSADGVCLDDYHGPFVPRKPSLAAARPLAGSSPDGIRWYAAADGREQIGDLLPLELEEWLRSGTAQIVKHGPHRTVYRIDQPAGQFYLKHYRCRSRMRSLRHLFRAAAARREFRRSHEIGRRKIPTVTALAYGEKRRRGVVSDSYLITAAIPNSVALDDYLANRLPLLNLRQRDLSRRRIAVALAKFCAAAHHAGIYHDDFHAGNLLLCDTLPRDGTGPELSLIDVPGVRLSGPLPWRASRAALVMLHTSLQPLASRTDCWRFWRAYMAARPDLSVAQPRVAAHEIEALARRAARRILRGRDRRAMRANSEFQSLRNSAGTAYAVSSCDRQTLDGLLVDPELPLRQFRHDPVKLGHGSLVVRASLSVADRPTKVAYKRTRCRSIWKSWLDRLRGRRALRAWKFGHALNARGVATPRPLAVFLPGKGPHQREGYLASEWIDNAENLHLYLWRIAGLPYDERDDRVRRLAASLGGLIGRMHFWQIAHGDLKGCNLMIVPRDDGVQSYVLDLDGVRIHRRLKRRARVRDLARLAASLAAHSWVGRTAALRFLRSYQDQMPGGTTDWKLLWRLAARRATAKNLRQRRDGKPIA